MNPGQAQERGPIMYTIFHSSTVGITSSYLTASFKGVARMPQEVMQDPAWYRGAQQSSFPLGEDSSRVHLIKGTHHHSNFSFPQQFRTPSKAFSLTFFWELSLNKPAKFIWFQAPSTCRIVHCTSLFIPLLMWTSLCKPLFQAICH